ncbi:MAG: hypothetical protein WB711_14840, partial [Terriglobales bacterium]
LSTVGQVVNGNVSLTGTLGVTGQIFSEELVAGVTGIFGNAGAANALVGTNNGKNFSAIGGINDDPIDLSYGVSGQSLSKIGVGVLGYGSTFSHLYKSIVGHQSFGVIGDATNVSGVVPVGVYGVADAGVGAVGENVSTTEPAGLFENFDTTAGDLSFEATGAHGHCTMDTSGDLVCTGTKSAAVKLPDDRWVRLYAMESPDNWFEDFGSGRLSDGKSVIKLESTFAATVNSNVDYHVFLTPSGDSRGLYVAKKTATWFEVREQGGGTSSIAFDYRIVARRKGYENIRMADVTERQQQIAASTQRMTPQKNNGSVRPPAQATNLHMPSLSQAKSSR